MLRKKPRKAITRAPWNFKIIWGTCYFYNCLPFSRALSRDHSSRWRRWGGPFYMNNSLFSIILCKNFMLISKYIQKFEIFCGILWANILKLENFDWMNEYLVSCPFYDLCLSHVSSLVSQLHSMRLYSSSEQPKLSAYNFSYHFYYQHLNHNSRPKTRRMGQKKKKWEQTKGTAL
jgi:hypothetical protein